MDDVGDFLGPTLFPGGRRPYSHQREAFERALVERRDVVVTTGTGSGKTECFLVPVLAELLRESAQWTPPGARAPTWDWWDDRHRTMQGQNPRYAQRVPQRGHETRPAAIRALLLYPLNALVEDQLVRLRVALDSPAPRAWLDAHRHGNRVYFGRYTSRTPIPGGRQGAAGRLRAELRDLSREAAAVCGSEAALFFQTFDMGSAEMWSRWDMQDHAPDLLITNYSMLNIMLMRSIEAGIFDQTRTWLAADRTHVFHLVVDELHTYRGTPGTEVAYLLRVLLDRLGLTPDSDQLRIIASSASLDAGQSGLEYLEGFFGRPRARFAVVGGSATPPNPAAIQTCAAREPPSATLAEPFKRTAATSRRRLARWPMLSAFRLRTGNLPKYSARLRLRPMQARRYAPLVGLAMRRCRSLHHSLPEHSFRLCPPPNVRMPWKVC